MVSSLAHISELSDAPLHKLSLHAVAKDVCNTSRPQIQDTLMVFCSFFNQSIPCMVSNGKRSEE